MHRLLLGVAITMAATYAQNAQDIVRSSVAVNDADWKNIPQYSHSETDSAKKLSGNGAVRSNTVKSFEHLMIDGTPYDKLVAINGHPLPADQVREENDKLKEEIERREHESPSERSARLAKYRKERANDHLLMHEMVNAFNFKLLGQENMNGHNCYVLSATPKPDYTPPNQEAKVLTGMQGKLWIDAQGYHWVKMEAEVIKPVSTYLVANVRPGTKFSYEQEPVKGVWLPSHFSQSVNASVLGLHSIRSQEDETYTQYRPAESASAYLNAIQRASR